MRASCGTICVHKYDPKIAYKDDCTYLLKTGL